jgi:hypothetical protein
VHPCPQAPHLTPIGAGLATYYAGGIFEEVLANRGIDPCPDCAGYAALLDPAAIGSRIWIRWPGGAIDGPYLVVDCAAAVHRAGLLARDWVIDVDRATARRHAMRGPVPVEIFW